MSLQIMAVIRQWLSSDRVGTQIHSNATIVSQQRNRDFYEVRAEML
jgi:hypothetical protein